MVLRFITFLLMVGLAFGATWIGRLPRKPAELANKEGCYIKEINDVIPFGAEVAPVGYCYRIDCGDMLYYASCGSVGTDDPACHVTDTDLSRSYPDCCPDIKCDLDNKLI